MGGIDRLARLLANATGRRAVLAASVAGIVGARATGVNRIRASDCAGLTAAMSQNPDGSVSCDVDACYAAGGCCDERGNCCDRGSGMVCGYPNSGGACAVAQIALGWCSRPSPVDPRCRVWTGLSKPVGPGDPVPCGACDHFCPKGTVCDWDVCVPASRCRRGETVCAVWPNGIDCVDLDSDDHNCGLCRRSCQEGRSCRDGRCRRIGRRRGGRERPRTTGQT